MTALQMDDFDIAVGLGIEYCPLMYDDTHCEHWWDGGPCCRCGAGADPHAFDDCDCDSDDIVMPDAKSWDTI